LNPLIDAGYLPLIGELIRGGTTAAVDESIGQGGLCCYCPPAWTSLATGQPVTVHGMTQIYHEPWDRGAPSVWQVVARRGGTSTQFAFRNTFPPEPGTTYGLTENAMTVAAADDVFTTWGASPDVRGEEMNRLQGTWPPLLLENVGILPHTGPRPE